MHNSLCHRASPLPTRRGLLHPAQPDAAATTTPHPTGRRGFCSARLMTSSSSSSSAASSSEGTPGFWEGPLGADDAAAALQGLLPQRQVPDSALRFTTVAYVDAGAYIPFPHADGIDPRAFGTNPANFKVTLKVRRVMGRGVCVGAKGLCGSHRMHGRPSHPLSTL